MDPNLHFSSFYTNLDFLLEDYNKEPQKEKLDKIYQLVDQYLKEIDPSTEIDHIDQLKDRLY